MNEFFQRLKQRKLVQWAIAYAAAAFAFLQGIDIVAQQFGWPEWVRRGLTLALVVGFFVTLVLAWYHGERGAQKVTGTELLILALLLSLGGAFLWRFAASSQTPKTVPPGPPVATTRDPVVLAASPAKSIAVLPFVNMSGEAGNDYFSDGITEEILNALSQIPDLKVAARTSAFAFKGKAEDLRKVGEVLDVANVLEGSVQKAGGAVRITAQLIDTHSGYHRWSDRYDRKLTSIFAVEDEISRAIADKLKVELAGGAGQSLVAQKAIDPHAHDAYLRGLALLASRQLRDAVVQFQNAVKLAPDYAQAWAGMAEAEALYPSYRLDSGAAAYPRALAAADRALALDPNCASAYVARGMVQSSQWQWAEAEQAFRKALALAPGDADAVNQYAQFLLEAGQLEAALKEADRVQQLDPLNKVNGVTRANALLSLHRYDAAWTQIQSVLALYPDFVDARGAGTDIAMTLKNYPEAEKQARAFEKLIGAGPEVVVRLVRAHVDPSLRGAVVAELKSSPDYAVLRAQPTEYAASLANVGENEEALHQLQVGVTQLDGINPLLIWGPDFDSIRDDPRFHAMLKKMGLPYKSAAGATP